MRRVSNAGHDALRMQHTLSQMIAHDMRNPLSAILANVSFLEHACGQEDGEVREALADMRSSSDDLLELIDAMVTLAALQSPEVASLPREPVSLAQAARDAVAAAHAAASRNSMRLELLVHDEARVSADAQLLGSMVSALVSNAVHHARKGTAVLLSVARESGRAVLTMSDEGPVFGPPAQHFTREAQPEIKLRAAGRYSRGLGLFKVGLVVDAFGGAIATSREGGRSVVRVTFPVA